MLLQLHIVIFNQNNAIIDECFGKMCCNNAKNIEHNARMYCNYGKKIIHYGIMCCNNAKMIIHFGIMNVIFAITFKYDAEYLLII